MHKTEELYYSLLKDWCDALISLQLTDIQRKELKGGWSVLHVEGYMVGQQMLFCR